MLYLILELLPLVQLRVGLLRAQRRPQRLRLRATSSSAFVLFLLATVWAAAAGLHRPQAGLPALLDHGRAGRSGLRCSRCSPGSTPSTSSFSIWALLGTADRGGDPGVRRPRAAARAAQPARHLPGGAGQRRPVGQPAGAGLGTSRGSRPAGRAPPQQRRRRRGAAPPPAAPPAYGAAARRAAGPAARPAPPAPAVAGRLTAGSGPGDPLSTATAPAGPATVPAGSLCVGLAGVAALSGASARAPTIRPAGLREWAAWSPCSHAFPGGARAGRPPALPLGWLAVAAAVAVTVTGLVGLGLAVVVVQTLDPAGGLPVAVRRSRWPAGCGCSPRAASWTRRSGPLVLAPLLLTARDRLGAVARPARPGPRCATLTAPRTPAAAAALVVGVHVVLTAGCWPLALDGPGAAVGLLRPGRRRRSCSPLVAVGWGVGRESGLLDAALDRLPGAHPPPAARRAGRAARRRWRCAPPSSRSPWPPTRTATPPCPARSAAPAPARSGCSASACCCCPNAAAAVLGLAAGPGLLRRRRHARLGARRHAGRRCPRCRCSPRCPTPRPCRCSPSCRRRCPRSPDWSPGRRSAAGSATRTADRSWRGLTGLLAGVAARRRQRRAACGSAGGSLGDGALAEVGAPAAGHRHRGGRAERDRRRARGHRRPLARRSAEAGGPGGRGRLGSFGAVPAALPDRAGPDRRPALRDRVAVRRPAGRDRRPRLPGRRSSPSAPTATPRASSTPAAAGMPDLRLRAVATTRPRRLGPRAGRRARRRTSPTWSSPPAS